MYQMCIALFLTVNFCVLRKHSVYHFRSNEELVKGIQTSKSPPRELPIWLMRLFWRTRKTRKIWAICGAPHNGKKWSDRNWTENWRPWHPRERFISHRVRARANRIIIYCGVVAICHTARHSATHILYKRALHLEEALNEFSLAQLAIVFFAYLACAWIYRICTRSRRKTRGISPARACIYLLLIYAAKHEIRCGDATCVLRANMRRRILCKQCTNASSIYSICEIWSRFVCAY